MTEEEFERIRDRIDLEVSHAADHLHLLQGLLATHPNYFLEMNESWTFWSLTFKAHYTVVLSQLCKLYDKTKGNLSLKRFLQAVNDHQDFFSDAGFRKRLAGNPHINTLAANRSIEAVELAAELASVSESDALVFRLLELRNKTGSHLDTGRIMQGIETTGLTVAELELLLRRARAITGKYSLLFRASVYGGMVGSDDYLSTLKWVRKALSAHQKSIDDEMELAS
ncbi:MAG TPA: hypothetical protein VGL82_21670 [Bryobacteraceae bacterium]|jgi:hypothetical protein